jgi:hypothetical protein
MNKTQNESDTHFVHCVDSANVKGIFMFTSYSNGFKSSLNSC